MNKSQDIPLISIALCTYNGEDFLEEQLDTLISQTYRNLEIIAVDDMSSDATWKILNNYANKHANLKIFKNKENLGYQKNFEKAIKLCQGEYIAISDQDDIWSSNKIQTLYDHIADNLLIYHDSEFIDVNGESMNLKMSNKFNMIVGENPKPFLFFNCVSGHSMMFNRKVLDLILPFPNTGVYDHWISYKASINGRIEYLPQCLVKHRRHLENNTDILGMINQKSGIEKTLERMERENKWLKVCAEDKGHPVSVLAKKLYKAGAERMHNYFNVNFAYLIWQHNSDILQIKNNENRLMFCIRQMWGAKLKAIFKKS